MDNKPMVGSPPEPIKPNTSNELKPAFSVTDLILMSVEDIDGVNWLTFDVSGQFMIVIKEWDYLAYLSSYHKKFKEAMERGSTCFCDSCQPNFTIISDTEHKVTFITQDPDTKEEKSVENYIPCYSVWDLDIFVEVGIHTDNHENINKIDG